MQYSIENNQGDTYSLILSVRLLFLASPRSKTRLQQEATVSCNDDANEREARRVHVSI